MYTYRATRVLVNVSVLEDGERLMAQRAVLFAGANDNALRKGEGCGECEESDRRQFGTTYLLAIRTTVVRDVALLGARLKETRSAKRS